MRGTRRLLPLLFGVLAALVPAAPASGTVRAITTSRGPRAAVPSAVKSCTGQPGAIRGVGDAGLVLVVTAASLASTSGTATLYLRVDGCLEPKAGPFPAELGAAGLATRRVEGDDTTPVGVFQIGSPIYGALADPGLHVAYHRLVCGDWWDEDSSSAQYNRFVQVPCDATPDFGGDSEALWREVPAYDYLAPIEFNTDPVVPGRGSGIFLHVSTGTPTAGCVSLRTPDLLVVLRALRPGLRSVIAIGTRASVFGS